jgi:arginine decarboxylase
VSESDPHSAPNDWSPEQSAALYQIEGWGQPYFRVDSEQGHVTVRPNPDVARDIDLFELVENARERGIALPLLIRFEDIVDHRIRVLNENFKTAMAECGYGGTYRGVYPVKVNQQRHLVEAIVSSGTEHGYGLEAGSKAELLIALAMTGKNAHIVCNGFKDAGYIETAFVAQQFDKRVFVVLERAEELEIALRSAKKVGIRPTLGVRAKLSARGVGRWADSAGDRAKFGLTKSELVRAVDRLKEEGMLDCLRLLHFHIGSQISSIMPIKSAVREAAHLYVELAKLGCPLGFLDVGGGLAVDYDGSQTDYTASRNYTLAEYAADVVTEVQDACREAGVAEPDIISESGRAAVAHQSILIFEVVGESAVRFGDPVEPPEDAHRVLHELYSTCLDVTPKNVQESWHDACQAKEEAQSLFRHGYLRLRELALVERLYWHSCERILDTCEQLASIPEELEALRKDMAAIYYCNFSIFQSAPDMWAIDQLFPIMPIHRLTERPTVRATLADLTCDSDGAITHFIDAEDERDTLELHAIEEGRPYYLAMFLNGAYQEILGDMHNLFGDTNAIHVRAADPGYDITHVIKGDATKDVLRYVQYQPPEMLESVRRQAERALAQGRIDIKQMRLLMRHYEGALNSSTYLSTEDEPPQSDDSRTLR